MEVTFSVDLASGRAGDGDSFMRTVVVSGKKNSALTNLLLVMGFEAVPVSCDGYCLGWVKGRCRQ